MYSIEYMLLTWNVFFKVYQVVNMSVSVSKFSFYTDANHCHHKNHTTTQNISLMKGRYQIVGIAK